MTLLVLIILENFDATRPLAILMRYTGDEKKEERKQAAKHVKSLFGKAKDAIHTENASENTPE